MCAYLGIYFLLNLNISKGIAPKAGTGSGTN